MSTAIGDLVVNLLGNGAPLQGTLNSANAQVAGFASRAQSQIAGIGGLAMKGLNFFGIGGIFLAGSLVATISKTVSLAGEQAKAEKKLQAVLTSTGHAVGFNADELKRYAGELQAVTNYGDEATIAGMAVLATFTQIKGDQFKGAIAAAQDLSTIMGQDLQSSIVQIGKALNDPIKGVTALRRIGVSFSQEQLAEIKKLVSGGDLKGAQDLILKELSVEFGGASKALASPVQQLRNAVGDLGEQIGFLITPHIRTSATWLRGWVEWGITGIGQLRERFQTTWLASQRFFAAVQNSGWPDWFAQIAKVTALGGAFLALIPIVAMVGSAGISLGASLLAWIFSPIGLIVVAAAALGAALVYAFGEGDTFAEKFNSTLAQIQTALDDALWAFRNLGNLGKLAFVEMALAAIEMFPQVESPMRNTFTVFVGTWAAAQAFFSKIVQSMIAAVETLGNAFAAVWEGTKAAWTALLAGDMTGIADAFASAFSKQFRAHVDTGFLEAFSDAQKAFKGGVKMAGLAVDAGGGMKGLLEGARQEILDQINRDEAALAAAAEAKKAEAGGPTAPTPPGMEPPGGKEGTHKPFAAAAERGTKEAYETIYRAMAGGQTDQQKQTNELLKQQLDVQEEMVAALAAEGGLEIPP